MPSVKRYAVFAVGLFGLIVGFVAVSEANALLALSGGLVGATALGWYQHMSADRENDERQMAIHYRAGYVSFWALYWFVTVFAMAGINSSESGDMSYELPMGTYQLVLTAWVLGTVSMIVTRVWYKRQF
ncbi:hypothetical protein HT576_15415 [Haloterrigena sp. SYSU A121-1]|uniref:DUF2178 domain-containing protein n=1 Tax=Haloterrigena gelatinilytica TaxID=2741724 RepID=A0A8J8GLW9_9EURY|nr:hypothetical protein [Haloterrigena gelatinilytica]NUB92404.1 hypothetical protein [Haloterrigena gelatinilytica]